MNRHPMHALCPYFAMFPESFVQHKVARLTKPRDLVFDPFSGRGTTVFQSLLMNRAAIATDINPVAFCISAAKADPCSLGSIRRRLRLIEQSLAEVPRAQRAELRQALPPFFRRAFHHETLDEVLALRTALDWKNSRVDRFIMALALGSLHGDSPSYFSNQMPRVISTRPGYSVDYWNREGQWPARRRAFELLWQRATFRLGAPMPQLKGEVQLSDARLASRRFQSAEEKVKLIVTSPPYFDVTSYEEDQWLRLWMLGGPPAPQQGLVSKDDRYTILDDYWEFLGEVWQGVGPLLARNGHIVVRIGGRGLDARGVTLDLVDSIRRGLPNARLARPPRSTKIVNRQTNTFRPGSAGVRHEIDYVVSA